MIGLVNGNAALAAWDGGDGKVGDDGHDLEDLPLFAMAGVC